MFRLTTAALFMLTACGDDAAVHTTQPLSVVGPTSVAPVPINVNTLRFGSSVAMTEEWLIVGSPACDDGPGPCIEEPGRVDVFRRNNDNFVHETVLTAPAAQVSDGFGFSVSASGSDLVVGCPYCDPDGNTDEGQVFVFRFDGSAWGSAQALRIPVPFTGQPGFGFALDMRQANMVVGVPFLDRPNQDEGAVLVYERNVGGVWQFVREIGDPIATLNGGFGRCVSLDPTGVSLLVTDFNLASTIGNNSAYIFSLEPVPALEGSFAQNASENYGWSCDLSETRAIVGSPGAGGADQFGAASVYRRMGATWAVDGRLDPSPPAMGSQFGRSVWIDGNRAIVGGPYATGNSPGTGAIVLFARESSGLWTQSPLAFDTADASPFSSEFGNVLSVSESGARVAVGAPRQDTFRGRVYAYRMARDNGESCSQSTQCGSGFCTDGVCCNVQCVRDAGNPCLACSRAAGGASDGTCGPIEAQASVVCRTPAGPCDVSEVCNGTATSCPVDGFLQSASQCRAAAGECDAAEFCSGMSAVCPTDTFDPSGSSCSGGVCDGGNLCVECVMAADCDDGNPCTVNTCTGNTCSAMNAAAGTGCGSGLSCNGSGSCTGCTLPGQCSDGNDCTNDVCTTGTCSNPPLTEGAVCAVGVCETSGTPSCVECVDDSQCSGGQPRCDTLINSCVACVVGSDCSDSNDCTSDVCTSGACSNPPLTVGTLCASGLCSAAGACVECLSDTDCSGTNPLCDVARGKCEPCTDPDVTCPSGVCVTSGTNAGLCAECNVSGDCSGTSPLCLPSSNTCVACTDAEALSMNITCPAGATCDAASGACVPTSLCSGDSDCASPTPVCDVAANRCIGCGDGSIVCPAAELCDPDTGRCGLDPNGDADDDGIVNGIECAALINCPDTDGDNIPDYLDSDDDGDSIPTNLECSDPDMCLDTDGDSIPNYLDPDDDGDGISTADEVADGLIHGSDVDLDGIPNYLDLDSDGDGSRDRVEGRNTSPNGIPAYLDVNFLGGGGIAGGAMRCSVGTGSNLPLSTVCLCLVALTIALNRRRTHLS